MAPKFMKSKKLQFTGLTPIFSMGSSDNGEKRKIFRRKPLKLGKKAYSILAIMAIAIILVSVFAFMPKAPQPQPVAPVSTQSPTASPTPVPQSTSPPTQQNPFSQIVDALSGLGNGIVQAVSPRAPGTIESNPPMNSTAWRQVAENAWNYFQPGVGVDSNTGLPNSGINVPYFTDWDLGGYIQAVIDAAQLNLISVNGTWGFNGRIDKVLTFLETRELNNASYPYWFYQSADGKDYHANSDRATSPVDIVDTGRLFVALNNLRAFSNGSLTQRINNIVLNGRSNYEALVPSVLADCQGSTSIYSYYFDSGFASFWPDKLSGAPNIILNNMLSAGNTTTPQGVTLPISAISDDPLLGSVFELNSANPQLMYIMHQVYLAHEAYYNATGIYRAFSEGSSLSDHWTYEWVVLPDNRTWVILNENNQPFNISPIIYTKVSIGFLALYNTSYAYNMTVYLERNLPVPSSGYCDGITEDGAQLTGSGSNANSLILDAAIYAIRNNP